MADQLVSNLPALSGADVDPADLLYIVDSSAGVAGSKKITVGQYQLAPVSGGTVNGVVYLDASKVESSSAGLTFDGTTLSSTGGFSGPYTGQATLTGTSTAPTAATGTNTTQIATTAFVEATKVAIFNALHPVGSIYINATNATNPATLLGFGTWTAFGAGRVPVGFNASNPLFDTAEETGGSADAIVVSHNHTTNTASLTGSIIGISESFSASGTTTGVFSKPSTGPNVLGTPDSPDISAGGTVAFDGSHGHTINSTGSSGTNANYQPYITVYMWKRTA